jgi:alkanesulfonate monooxygenase SsuD/methylene tetrahydromethanopterin reductase-like flavin-dependent oxidoreductase (luciferase family)
VDVMAQQLHGIHGATPGQHDAIDQANREAFEEHFRIIKQAWTGDMLAYQGKYWQIPPPGTPWDLDATRQWGAGIGPDQTVRAIGVVPKPVQQPHPPIFQPFASSENTIRWCAREEVTAILPPMEIGMQNRLYEVYQQEGAQAGRSLQPGEGLGVLRDVIVADTDEQAMALWRHGAAFCGAAWFAPFHFGDVLRVPGREQPLSVREMSELGLLLVGSVDTVTRQMERMLALTPVRWIFAWQYNGLVPNPAILRSLELFQTEVMPRFAGSTVG